MKACKGLNITSGNRADFQQRFLHDSSFIAE